MLRRTVMDWSGQLVRRNYPGKAFMADFFPPMGVRGG
jgi:hypothetical protein